MVESSLFDIIFSFTVNQVDVSFRFLHRYTDRNNMTSQTTYSIQTKETKPFSDQKPGTSGLRKPTKTFMQPLYTENFVQSILTAGLNELLQSRQHVRLVLGGDGRYFVKESLLSIIIPMCAANGVSFYRQNQWNWFCEPRC